MLIRLSEKWYTEIGVIADCVKLLRGGIMNRAEKGSRYRVKSNIKLFSIFIITVIPLLFGLFSFDVLTPEDLSFEIAEDMVYRKVTIVLVGEPAYNERRGTYLVHTLTDKGEILVLKYEEEKTYKYLKTASKLNPIKLVGELEEPSQDFVQNVREEYEEMDIPVYEYIFVFVSDFERFGTTVMIFLIPLSVLLIMIYRNRQFKKLILFIEENPRYDSTFANFEMGNYVEVVESTMFNFKTAVMIDLEDYDRIEIGSKRTFFFLIKMIVLKCYFGNELKSKMTLGRFSQTNVESLQEYLTMIGKN